MLSCFFPVPSPDVERLQSASCLLLWLDTSFFQWTVIYTWRRPTFSEVCDLSDTHIRYWPVCGCVGKSQQDTLQQKLTSAFLLFLNCIVMFVKKIEMTVFNNIETNPFILNFIYIPHSFPLAFLSDSWRNKVSTVCIVIYSNLYLVQVKARLPKWTLALHYSLHYVLPLQRFTENGGILMQFNWREKIERSTCLNLNRKSKSINLTSYYFLWLLLTRLWACDICSSCYSFCVCACVQTDGEDSRLFQWHDGPLVLAMKEGGVFLMDEISLADDSVLERLNR